jgi:hypothetical protein
MHEEQEEQRREAAGRLRALEDERRNIEVQLDREREVRTHAEVIR